MKAMVLNTLSLVIHTLTAILGIVDSQGLTPELGVTFHLRAVCAPYHLELAKKGNICTSSVIDEVHDYAEAVNLQGYNRDLVEEYLDFANTGQLCYGEGLTIYKITNDCDCMNKICDRFNPRNIDYCTNIVLSPFAPSGNLSSPWDCYGFGCLDGGPGLISGAQRTIPHHWMLLVSVAMITVVAITTHARRMIV